MARPSVPQWFEAHSSIVETFLVDTAPDPADSISNVVRSSQSPVFAAKGLILMKDVCKP